MWDKLILSWTAEPATGELQRNTPGCVVLRMENNLRPLFSRGKQNRWLKVVEGWGGWIAPAQ
jgi:hypothetical protein